MRLSSISSSKGHRSSSLLFALILGGLVLGSEISLRIPAVRHALPQPEPTLWHSPVIQAKLDYLKKFQAKRGIDVLFIGNSAVQSGISPAVFDAVMGGQANVQEESFNAAIEGLPPYGVRLFLEIYLRYTQPRVVVYGLTPQDMNSNSPWAHDVTTRVRDSVLAQAESRSGVRGWIYSELLDYSYLFRYRYLLHQLIVRGGQAAAEPYIYFDDRGFHPLPRRLSDLPPARRFSYFNRAGVLNYTTEGAQLKEIERIIQICEAEQIRLILVNMPLSDNYYANFDRPADYATYLDTLQRLGRTYGLPIWDMEHMPPPDNLTDEDFADFNHLNKWGATRLSEMIGHRFRDLAGQKVQWVRR